MNIDLVFSGAFQEFEKVLSHLKDEFSRLQIGRANPALIENISVDVYGSSQPVKAVASISVPDPRTLMIQPWDRSTLASIEKAIVGTGMGLNPINDGVVVRINIPPLTAERRADLTKIVKKLGEEARISIRNARQTAHNSFKKMKADSEITEDDLHSADKKLQTKVDEVNKKIDEMSEMKEKDIMTI